jgi:hypothetical protein
LEKAISCLDASAATIRAHAGIFVPHGSTSIIRSPTTMHAPPVTNAATKSKNSVSARSIAVLLFLLRFRLTREMLKRPLACHPFRAGVMHGNAMPARIAPAGQTIARKSVGLAIEA